MTKRIFSLLVALCLIVGLLPAVAVPHAHAEEGGALATPYVLIMGGDTSSSYTTYTLNNYDTAIYTKNTTKTDGYFNKGAVTGTYIGQSKSGATEENYNAKLIWHSGDTYPTLYLRNCIMDNYDEDNKYWRQRSSSNTTVKQYPALYTGSTAPLKIVLEEGKSELKVYSGIHYQNDLTIESVGDASLTLWTQINGIIPNSANKAASALNVTGKKLTLNANLTVSVGGRNGSVLNHVILARGADMVIDGGNIVTEYRPTSKANMSGIGVLTSGNLVINGGSVSAKAYNADNTAGAAYLVEFGNITITDGKVEAYSELQSGLRAKNIYISGGEVITDTNHGGLVVTAESGEISVTGGTFKGFTRGGADYPFAYNGASAQAVKIPVLGEGATIMAGDDEETAELVEDLDTFAYTKHYMFVAFEEAEEPTCDHTNTTTTEVVTKDATCTEAGSKTVTVTCECGEVISEESVAIDSLGHTPKDAVVENETATSYDSVVYCSVCNAELSRETIETGCKHANTTTTEKVLVAETCTTAGSKKVTVACADCGETLSEETVEIPAASEAHVYDGVSDTDCNNCGATRTADKFEVVGKKIVITEGKTVKKLTTLFVFYIGEDDAIDIYNFEYLRKLGVQNGLYQAGYRAFHGMQKVEAVRLQKEGNYVLFMQYTDMDGNNKYYAEQVSLRNLPLISVNEFKPTVNMRISENTFQEMFVFYVGQEKPEDLYTFGTLKTIGQKYPEAYGANGYKSYKYVNTFNNTVTVPLEGNYVFLLKYLEPSGTVQYAAELITVHPKPQISLNGTKVVVDARVETNVVSQIQVFYVGDTAVKDMLSFSELKTISLTYPDAYGTTGYKSFSGASLQYAKVVGVEGDYVVLVKYTDVFGATKYTSARLTYTAE